LNFLKIKRVVRDSEKRLVLSNQKSIFEKYSNFIALIIAIAALVYTIWRTETSIQMAKDSDLQSRISSMVTQNLATLTITHLQSISKSTNSFNNNLDSFSNTLIPLNKSLLELTNTLVSVNKLSNEQLKNLTTINNNITEQLLLSRNIDSLNKINYSKRPHLIAYIECDYANEKFIVYLENIGSLRAQINLEYYIRGSGGHNSFDLNSMEKTDLGQFSGRSYMEGDSTKVEIKARYFSASTDQSYNLNLQYIKCK